MNMVGDLFLPADQELTEMLEGWARQARATKTAGRIHASRAKSEEVLRSILPETFDEGDHWHVLSSGDVDAMSYCAHLLRTRPAEYLLFSTWHMARDDIERLNAWLQSGHVKRVDAYIGEIFRGSYPTEYGALCATVRPHGGRVATFRNHSKVFCIACAGERFVIESSANVNTNPRCENTVLTKPAALYDHHKRYFDEVRAFNLTDFPGWTPYSHQSSQA